MVRYKMENRTATDNIHGRVDNCTLVNLKMVKKMDMEFGHIPVVKNMLEPGEMANIMAMEY